VVRPNLKARPRMARLKTLSVTTARTRGTGRGIARSIWEI